MRGLHVRAEDDPGVDGAIAVSFPKRDDGIEVDLLDRLGVEDELGEPQDGIHERVDIARRLAPHAFQEWIRPDGLVHPPRVSIRERRQSERDVLQVFYVDSAEAEDEERAVDLVAGHPEDDFLAASHELLDDVPVERHPGLAKSVPHLGRAFEQVFLRADVQDDRAEVGLVD